MLKKVGAVLAVLVLLIAGGCSSVKTTTPTTTQPANLDTLRQAEIAGQWALTQLRINLDSGIPVLLKLNPGDTVDGYFYLEKGTDIDFQIAGKTLLYQAVSPAGATGNITSGRFSFTATEAQGIAYTLTFTPVETAGAKKVTPVIFMELIYPKTGQLFNPTGTK